MTMSSEAFEIRHVFVEGQVQGVGYRDFVRRAARRLSVRGWTRNRTDGTVEVFAVGNAETLNALLAQLRQGPGLVSTLRVAGTDRLDGEAPESFVIRPTF
jgi:acylphosphatase